MSSLHIVMLTLSYSDTETRGKSTSKKWTSKSDSHLPKNSCSLCFNENPIIGLSPSKKFLFSLLQ